MFLHHLASHLQCSGGVREILENMTPSDITNWMAYFRLWPVGEWALDKRFEVLRLDIASLREQMRIGIPVIQVKRGGRPKRVTLEDMKIFQRHGDSNTKYYDEMTQEEINDRMRAFAIGLKSKGENG